MFAVVAFTSNVLIDKFLNDKSSKFAFWAIAYYKSIQLHVRVLTHVITDSPFLLLIIKSSRSAVWGWGCHIGLSDYSCADIE